MLNMGSININATSRIEETDAAYFNASFSELNGGNYTISKNVVNMTVYEQNQAECDADYAAFEEKSKAIVEKIRETEV